MVIDIYSRGDVFLAKLLGAGSIVCGRKLLPRNLLTKKGVAKMDFAGGLGGGLAGGVRRNNHHPCIHNGNDNSKISKSTHKAIFSTTPPQAGFMDDERAPIRAALVTKLKVSSEMLFLLGLLHVVAFPDWWNGVRGVGGCCGISGLVEWRKEDEAWTQV